MKQISENSESLTDVLLAMLGSARNTRRFKSILYERKLKRYKIDSTRVALSRLQAKGYVENSKNGWTITNKGRSHIDRNRFLDYFPSPFTKSSSVNIILSFDIKIADRRKRDWLRNQIKIFGYKMLQQSLWLGPGPLPPAFLKRLEDLQIKKSVRIFKVSAQK